MSEAARASSLTDLISSHRVVVCVGSGGVGKTTIAAALGLWGALNGRRSMVLTIDPARRLAQSLGLETLAADGERIDPQRLAECGLAVTGDMFAGMLDQKSAWDGFIRRYAPTPEAAETILANGFYQQLSRSFAGSTEYMAIEELYRIHESGRYDLIVLDTPPTAYALDFLEAPERLSRFLDRATVRWFVRPYATLGWSAWKTASRSVRYLFSRIEDATGGQTLSQISEFFILMEEAFDGIAQRSSRVQGLLKGPDTAFVLVTGPDEQVLDDTEYLSGRMEKLGVPLKAVLMNRLHVEPQGSDSSHVSEYLSWLQHYLEAHGVDARARAWLVDAYKEACRLARVEAVRRDAFELGLGDTVVTAAVPDMGRDVHDLATLGEIVERF